MARSSTDRGASHRLLRVGENLRHALAESLARGDFLAPEIAAVPITVSEVKVSPDLRHATAYVMPLAGARQDDVLAALNKAAPRFQGALGRSARLKYTPRLSFKLDRSFDEAGHIDRLLADPRVRRDLKE